MAHVRIPASLRGFTQNKGEVVVSGSTVAEVLDNLEPAYPGLRARILDEKGALRRYVNVFQNEEDIRFLQELKTAVKDDDRLTIVPAIAGVMDVTTLPAPEIQRYVRQLLLPEIGIDGQARLGAIRVELIGAGLAVETAHDYLSRAGIGAHAAGGSGPVLRVNGEGIEGSPRFALNDRGFAWSDRGSPCCTCLQAWLRELALPPAAAQPALAIAAGALAASQLLLAALGLMSGGSPGNGLGFAFWPSLSRRQVVPRPACGCAAVAGG